MVKLFSLPEQNVKFAVFFFDVFNNPSPVRCRPDYIVPRYFRINEDRECPAFHFLDFAPDQYHRLRAREISGIYNIFLAHSFFLRRFRRIEKALPLFKSQTWLIKKSWNALHIGLVARLRSLTR